MYKDLGKERREEYKERFNNLKESYLNPLSLFLTYLRWTLLTAVLLLIVLPLWKIGYPDIAPTILKMFIGIFRIMVLAMQVGLIIDIMLIGAYMYKVFKLKEEYFGKKKDKCKCRRCR